MTKNETMIYELQSEAIFARGKESIDIPAQDSGIIEQDFLAKAKEVTVVNSIKWACNHLVKDKQGYPSHGLIKTDLEVNMVILPENLYTKLIKHLDE